MIGSPETPRTERLETEDIPLKAPWTQEVDGGLRQGLRVQSTVRLVHPPTWSSGVPGD